MKLMAAITALVIAGVLTPITVAWAGCIGCDGFYEDNQPTLAQGDVVMPEVVIPVTVQTVRPAPRRVIVTTAPSHIVDSSGEGIWGCIARHESGGNAAYNDGQFEGLYNFLHSTWVSAGGRRYAEHAYQATPAQQTEIARSWLARTSWSQWPRTSRMCGVR